MTKLEWQLRPPWNRQIGPDLEVPAGQKETPMTVEEFADQYLCADRAIIFRKNLDADPVSVKEFALAVASFVVREIGSLNIFQYHVPQNGGSNPRCALCKLEKVIQSLGLSVKGPGR